MSFLCLLGSQPPVPPEGLLVLSDRGKAELQSRHDNRGDLPIWGEQTSQLSREICRTHRRNFAPQVEAPSPSLGFDRHDLQNSPKMSSEHERPLCKRRVCFCSIPLPELRDGAGSGAGVSSAEAPAGGRAVWPRHSSSPSFLGTVVETNRRGLSTLKCRR